MRARSVEIPSVNTVFVRWGSRGVARSAFVPTVLELAILSEGGTDRIAGLLDFSGSFGRFASFSGINGSPVRESFGGSFVSVPIMNRGVPMGALIFSISESLDDGLG